MIEEDLAKRIERYFRIEEEAIKKIRISPAEGSFLRKIAEDNMEMIMSYYSDAKDFYRKGDLINAFAALNYSYGWIDAGVRLGIFDGAGDHRLFTLYE
ncbi:MULTISPECIES: DUF357 domain-containing protein [unclassified Thermoplasma]|uniref:DUF357 domain-containing protein n=1 Tax=unclassified Thermoplasma TaxID=2684908 RepID=UPI000D9D6261|nr:MULTISPECIES: DUF357 domain-containing protein [unclassified Thermoplasma]PYB68902.1 DUF357 domain-containing protein [Thermoplasma sp. Kam2015]